MNLRLLTYNIRHGGKGREAPLAAAVRRCDPDVVILQEATNQNVVEQLAAAAGMTACATRPRLSLGFMSRIPIGTYAWHRPRLSRHAFIEIAPKDLPVRLFGVHLSAVHAAWTERRRMMELRALLQTIREHQDGFHLLAGDFNTLAPGELLDPRRLPYRLRAMVWLSGGRVRYRTIDLVRQARYADMFRRLNPGDPGLTFPTWNPHVRLDYVFVPEAFAPRVVSCEVMRGEEFEAASDHFPLLANIEVV